MRATDLAIVALIVALGGCGGETATPAAPDPPATARNWGEEVQLARVTFHEWERELESMKGRIVVVDNWATWCAPCIERFPAMVAMAREWEPRGVTFVTLSLDGTDDPESVEQVRGFLETQDARMPNYIMDEVVPDAFEKLNLLGIPAVFVYDAEGTMTHRLTGDDPNRQYTEADVEEAVRSLVERRS